MTSRPVAAETKVETTAGIMVIVTTGRPTRKVEQRMREAGADAWLPKPFKAVQVLESFRPNRG